VRVRPSLPVAVWMAVAASVGLAACATSPDPKAAGGSAARGHVIPVAASINAWGSVAAQLGGDLVSVTSIITNPATDPHDYEPTPTDGRTVADARLAIENGVGYDSWFSRAVAANPDPDRAVVDVGRLVGVPADANPHRWYSPADVVRVADAVTAELKRLDPDHAASFDSRRSAFATTGLAGYQRLVADIRERYAGVPVGASESLFVPMSDALGLRLVTPPAFLRAISEGTDPSAADKATIDAQIAGREIEVYVFDSQNSTPDVAAQVEAAKAAGIPVVAITETLSPASARFQDWQSAQLTALQAALARATGR